jgi:hypothetical protein
MHMRAIEWIQRLLLITLVSAMGLTGCAFPTGARVGKLPALTQGAQLVVYRPKDNVSLYFQGFLDAVKQPGDIKNGGVTVLPLSPGAHSFSLRLSSAFPSSSLSANTASFTVENGQRVYLRVTPLSGSETIRYIGGGITVTGDYVYGIVLVPAQTAEAEVADLRYVR